MSKRALIMSRLFILISAETVDEQQGDYVTTTQNLPDHFNKRLDFQRCNSSFSWSISHFFDSKFQYEKGILKARYKLGELINRDLIIISRGEERKCPKCSLSGHEERTAGRHCV